MKLDVLDGLKNVKICTKYKLDRKEIDYFPANINDVEKCKPVYEELKGWESIDKDACKISDLPKEAREYLKFIENKLGIPYALISIGPGRTETIEV